MERDLVTSEGVDEASADSTVEGPSSGGSPEAGTAAGAASSRPARESDPAPPDELSPEVGDDDGVPAPGQELSVGEG